MNYTEYLASVTPHKPKQPNQPTNLLYGLSKNYAIAMPKDTQRTRPRTALLKNIACHISIARNTPITGISHSNYNYFCPQNPPGVRS